MISIVVAEPIDVLDAGEVAFLDSIWRELYLRQIESFALGHRTSVFSVHPTDPPLFV